MYIATGSSYRMRSMFRSHPSYDVRKTVMVTEVDSEDRVWFTCLNGEGRFLPRGQFANQYFETTGCDLTD